MARLRAEGKDVVEIELEPDLDWERAARETEDALARGVIARANSFRPFWP